MYNEIKPILPDNFGGTMSSEHFSSLTSYQVKMLLVRKAFLIVKDIDFDNEDKFISLMSSYGTLIEYVNKNEEVIYDYKDSLKLDGDTNKFGSGRGELPIHADGGLSQTNDDLLFLYAVKIKNMPFQGATTVCNHELFYQEMPYHLKKVLDEEVFEVRVLDIGDYSEACPADWFTVPIHTDYGWGRKMFIYFPFTGNNIADWESRIRGFTESETKDFFSELLSFITQPRYYYRHFWKTGDLMLMDNRRVLHAREPFDNDTERVLYRGSVRVEEA